MSEKHAYDDDSTTRKRPRVWKLPMHWWLYLSHQYQDGLAGRDAGFDYHVLIEFNFDAQRSPPHRRYINRPPYNWYSSKKPWSGITLDLNTKRNVTEINLSGLELARLPDSIGDLKLLTWLDLNHNFLTRLPDSISELISLTWLNISDNYLTILPESINKLVSLKWLNLRDNFFRTFPDSTCDLQSLTWLDLSLNWLSEDADDEYRERFSRPGLCIIY